MLSRIADLTWTRPKAVLGVIAALAIVAGAFGYDVEDHLTPAGFTDPGSESEHATRVLHGALGYDANPALTVLVRGGSGPRDPEVMRLSGLIADAPHVAKVDPPLPARDGESVVILAHLDTLDLEAAGGDTADAVKHAVRGSKLDVGVGGFAAGFDETAEQSRKDLSNAELIAFPALTILLLLVFRGVIASLIPLLIGVLSILGTFLVLRVLTSFTDVSAFALNISTSLCLGLAVDYALLLVSRYREELARLGPTREAHRRTVLTAGRTSLFSGFTVGAASAALIVMPQRFLYSIGAAGLAVGLLSALLAVLVVPSLLRLLGENVDKWSTRRGPSVADASSRWYRLSWGVMRRPVLVAVAASVGLLALAAPLFGARLTGPSAEAVPPGLQSYEPDKYIQAHYPRDVIEAVTVTVAGTDRDLAGLQREIAAVPHVSRATPFKPVGDGVSVATVGLDGPALAATSQAAVRAIRRLAPPGGELLVSGNTARFIDLKQSLVAHVPIVVGLVAALTLVLLFLLTGSVLLPIKTLIMNALTIGATLGILVLGFQVGLLETPLDYPGPDSVEIISMVFMFATLFGLATDYAVLVMARIREHHEAGMDNEEAVATAMSRTGRVISAAALAIAIVFLSFGVSPVFFMKQIAVGLAAGVLIDATIVRALLVPALMRLLGKWNWWAPEPLKRLHARVGLQDA